MGIITGNQPGEWIIGGPDAGTKGSDLPDTPQEERHSWPAGSHQEVSWNIYANHGGGYSYRLCKKADGEKLTEECFQQNPLNFASDQSWIQYGAEKQTVRLSMRLVLWRVRTLPVHTGKRILSQLAGEMWE